MKTIPGRLIRDLLDALDLPLDETNRIALLTGEGEILHVEANGIIVLHYLRNEQGRFYVAADRKVAHENVIARVDWSQ